MKMSVIFGCIIKVVSGYNWEVNVNIRFLERPKILFQVVGMEA